MNELRVACEVWSTEVCEVSLTKNLRGKPAKIRLGKVWENLEKDSPWLLVLPWNERLHGVSTQVIMELVHMHEGLVRFPAVAGLVEYRPSNVELQGGSSIAVAAMSKDRLNDELLLIVLSYRQRIGADGIVDERAKVVDMCSNPLAGH